MNPKLLHALEPRAARRRWSAAVSILGVAAGLVATPALAEGILGSKHDLSLVGPGPIKAVTETGVCIFCHTPHRSTGETPLWNHTLSSATYVPYSSSTLKAVVGQPTGASKLCLSCHDGTIALGMVHSRSTPIAMKDSVITMPPGPSRVGTDLSDDHPVSFIYDNALAAKAGHLRDPGTLNEKVRLDANKQMQCTSCHDPHNNRYRKFLVQENQGSALCLNCHEMSGWNTSSHRLSNKTWNGSGLDPWPRSDHATVSANGCGSCHANHGAGTRQRLLNHPLEENNCYSCHNGNVAAKNLVPEFNKLSAHPILDNSGVHSPNEDPLNATRHVECEDCHNPHAVSSLPATAPNASGAILGVRGVNSAGNLVNAATREYEVCFRCHADSLSRGRSSVPRQFVQTNTRLAFAGHNASYHPVVAPGKNANVPSLLAPYTAGSFIYCTDCHNNDQGPGAGGTGARGPHGSMYPALLERQMDLNDGSPENLTTYALCYKCHDRSRLLSDQSFPHRKHVQEARTSCATCHDPHGVQGQSHLINFNTYYVTKSSNGRIEFNRTGTFRGNCSLTCHGVDHRAQSY